MLKKVSEKKKDTLPGDQNDSGSEKCVNVRVFVEPQG